MSELNKELGPVIDIPKEQVRKLTKRQKLYRLNRLKGMNQYNAARAAGYSHKNANKNGARIERLGRVGIKDLFEQAGLTDKWLIQYAEEALQATKVLDIREVEGKMTKIEHADWVARHKFFESVCELTERLKPAGVTINDNSKHVTQIFLSDKLKQARERVRNARANVTESAATAG